MRKLMGTLQWRNYLQNHQTSLTYILIISVYLMQWYQIRSDQKVITAVKNIIYKGEEISKKTSIRLTPVEVSQRISLGAEMQAYFKKTVCYKCINGFKFTLNFRFATIAMTENLNVVTPFAFLAEGNYMDAQFAMHSWKIHKTLFKLRNEYYHYCFHN